MVNNLVELSIQGIAYNAATKTPVILLHTKSDHFVLPIEVGPFEANTILVRLKGIETPRMLTHALFASFMKRHRFKVERLLIFSREKKNYKAKLQYRKGRRTYMMDVRPSDGIALSIGPLPPEHPVGSARLKNHKEMIAPLSIAVRHGMFGLFPWVVADQCVLGCEIGAKTWHHPEPEQRDP